MNREPPINDTCGVHRPAAVIVLGALLGAAIWWLSPKITGEIEPWDAQGHYYWTSASIAGFVAALPYSRRFWLAPVGLYIGQLAYGLIWMRFGPLFAVGMFLLVLSSVPALVGGGLAWATTRFVSGMFDWRKPES